MSVSRLLLLAGIVIWADGSAQQLADEDPRLAVSGPMYGHIMRTFFAENDPDASDVKRFPAFFPRVVSCPALLLSDQERRPT